jgi:hypothetical protein
MGKRTISPQAHQTHCAFSFVNSIVNRILILLILRQIHRFMTLTAG